MMASLHPSSFPSENLRAVCILDCCAYDVSRLICANVRFPHSLTSNEKESVRVDTPERSELRTAPRVASLSVLTYPTEPGPVITKCRGMERGLACYWERDVLVRMPKVVYKAAEGQALFSTLTETRSGVCSAQKNACPVKTRCRYL